MAPMAVAVCMAPAHNAHESAAPSNIPRCKCPQGQSEAAEIEITVMSEATRKST